LTSHVREKHVLKEKTHSRRSRLKNQKRKDQSHVFGGKKGLEKQHSRTSRSKNQKHKDHVSRFGGKRALTKTQSGPNQF
jgi:hypothetical protein